MRMRFLLLFLLFAGPTFAQSWGSTAPYYLLRIQRTTRDADHCVLLKSDGSYRLELDDRESQRVFDGTLSAAQLEDVTQQLRDPVLTGLSQDQIPAPPLEARDVEITALAIDRPLGTQNLSFRSPKSREMVKAPVDKLLALLKALPAEPHQELPASDAAHCMPPRPKVALRQRSGSADGPSRAPARQYLLALKYLRQRSYLEAERKCVLVYADGRYRIEHARQLADADQTGSVVEGNVSPEKLAVLRHLLSSDELQGAKSAEMPKQRFREGETTLVLVPRGDYVQTLAFGSGFAASVGALHALQNAGFGDDRPLKPLLRWFKALENRKVSPSPGAALNGCNDAESE